MSVRKADDFIADIERQFDWFLVYVPALPVHAPLVYAALALIVSLGVGLASGLMPARHAAALDPVVALTAE